MIKNRIPKYSFSLSLAIALLFHLVVLFFVKKNDFNTSLDAGLLGQNKESIKIDRIELIKPSEVQQLMKRVGIKNGAKKEYLQPDILKVPKALPPPTKGLSLGNLAPDLPAPKMTKKPNDQKNDLKPKAEHTLNKEVAESSRPILDIQSSSDSTGHIYYNPKKQKKIPQDQGQENLKQEVYKNTALNSSNPVAQKMSNFDIRYERPEGVSEDELNSDEKAYYSFFKRSYQNYLEKLYATYNKVSIERPGLEKDFNNKHVLLGRIDYDDKGNIILVKILKSSESDDIHYFFEETLKQLNLPNPPKSFIKNKKQFTTYYQIQIN